MWQHVSTSKGDLQAGGIKYIKGNVYPLRSKLVAALKI